MSKRIVIIPDTQIPYHDKKKLWAVTKFIGDTQPDEVIHIGDIMDYPQPSRWNKDTRGEFEGSVLRDSDYGKQWLDYLRLVYDGPVGIHEGNHDLRPREYLAKYAPALDESGELFHIKKLLDFDGYGVTALPDFYPVAPGWLTSHGHVGQISLSRNPGSTAVNGADKFGKSLIIGHTHRAGIVPRTHGYGGGVTKLLWGVEAGHLMDMRKAHYLKGGTGNWQQAFVILDIDGRHVQPTIVPVGRKFIVDGYTWEVQ